MKKLLAIFPIALLLLAMPVIATNTGFVSVTASVVKYISVTFSYSSVDFFEVSAGTINNEPTPSHTTGIYNVSIDTNYAYSIYAFGTDFSDGAGHTFSISNLKFDTDSAVSGLSINNAKALSNEGQEIDSYDATVTLNYHGYWLSIPAGQYAGRYSSTVAIDYRNQ
jgi:hypothetical protein